MQAFFNKFKKRHSLQSDKSIFSEIPQDDVLVLNHIDERSIIIDSNSKKLKRSLTKGKSDGLLRRSSKKSLNNESEKKSPLPETSSRNSNEKMKKNSSPLSPVTRSQESLLPRIIKKDSEKIKQSKHKSLPLSSHSPIGEGEKKDHSKASSTPPRKDSYELQSSNNKSRRSSFSFTAIDSEKLPELRFGVHTIKGARKTQEDSHSQYQNETGFSFFGVYDG